MPVDVTALTAADVLWARYDERSRGFEVCWIERVLDRTERRWGTDSVEIVHLSWQLRDVAAKRAVADRLMWILGNAGEQLVLSTAEHVLLLLLQPYEDHPGFGNR